MLRSVPPQKIVPPLVCLGAHAALRAVSAASAASASLALRAAPSASVASTPLALPDTPPRSRQFPTTLRETNDTWDNGREHAWTQVHAALRPRGRVHCKAPL